MNISFKEEKGFYLDLFTTCFLIVISLGLYLPWGITKLRKNIWSKISLDGERFYYIGEAKELLMGYLFLLALYGLSKAIQFMAPTLFGQSALVIGATSFIGSTIFFTLFLKSRLGSFRYQTHRTVYSGIRLKTDLPSPKKQYIKCLKWGVITTLTFGLALTYFVFRVDQFKYNSLSYGDEKLQFSMTVNEYLKLILAYSLRLLISFFIVMGLFTIVIVSFKLKIDTSIFFNGGAGAVIGGMIVVLFLTLTMVYCTSRFMSDFFKAKCHHLSSQNITFSTSLTTTRVIKYNLINLLIIVSTLGLGFPLVLVNNVKLLADTISVNGLEGLLVENQLALVGKDISDSFDDLYTFDLDMFDAF